MTPMLGIMASSISGSKAVTNSYESIATVTVGSGGASTVDFTSIPSTYKHLQIRGIGRSLNGSNNASLGVRFNSDSGNNYPFHQIFGDGSSAGATGGAANDGYGTALQGPISSSNSLSSTFASVLIDILDYANTNKYKTLRGLAGFDYNGSGQITLRSSMWMSTSATTSLSLFTYNSGAAQGFAQYTSFALYGIKG